MKVITVKVAVPLFGCRVSPRFDCAQVFLIVTVAEGSGEQRQELTATDWTPHERINRLAELGVQIVICGGIDWWSAQSLKMAGMTVCNAVTGDVNDVLAAWSRGELDVPEHIPEHAQADLSSPDDHGATARRNQEDWNTAQPPRSGGGTKR